jgi:hypothetical protein
VRRFLRRRRGISAMTRGARQTLRIFSAIERVEHVSACVVAVHRLDVVVTFQAAFGRLLRRRVLRRRQVQPRGAGVDVAVAIGVAVGIGIAKMLRFSASVSRFQNADITTQANIRMTRILIRDLVLRFDSILGCLKHTPRSRQFSSRSD